MNDTTATTDPYSNIPGGDPGSPYIDPASGRLVDPLATTDYRTYALLMHLSLFAHFILTPVVAFLIPLVMWLLKKNESAFIADHGRQALNLQLSWLLWSILLFIPFGCLTLGLTILLIGLLYIPAAVFAVMGAIAANKGEYYRYPLVWEFFSAPRR